MLRPYFFRRYASVLLSQSSRGGQNTSTSSVSSSACASCGRCEGRCCTCPRTHHDLFGARLPHEEPQRTFQDVGELLVLVRVLGDDTAFLQVHVREHDAVAGDETA